MYTKSQWRADRDLKAQPGEEIEAAIYEELREVMPPLHISVEATDAARERYGIPVHAGFMLGEPTASDADGPLYRAFVSNDYGKGKHCYYVGLFHEQPKVKDGTYYMIECGNAVVDGFLLPAKDFTDDADAIRTAADYEGTLYKMEYKDGQEINYTILYDPI